jgi:hypothetical protein
LLPDSQTFVFLTFTLISSCLGFKPLDLNPNIWRPQCFKLKKPPLRCHQGESTSVSCDRETKPHHYHPPKPCHTSPKAMRLKPSLRSKKSSCNKRRLKTKHRRHPKPITSMGTFTSSSQSGACRVRPTSSGKLGGRSLRG